MTLKLYYDLLSQPSRTVYIFLKVNNIQFDPIAVALRKKANLSDDFKQINRFQKVPAIDDNGFKVMESVAILRYLARERSVADHWFPKDSKKQAKVDEYLEWQHHNTRFLCNFYFQRKYLMPLQTGKPTKEELIEESEYRMTSCFEKIEELWLGNNKFLAGNEISVADIIAACEIEQTRLAGFDTNEEFTKLSDWLVRVKEILSPHFEEAHSIVYKLAKKQNM